MSSRESTQQDFPRIYSSQEKLEILQFHMGCVKEAEAPKPKIQAHLTLSSTAANSCHTQCCASEEANALLQFMLTWLSQLPFPEWPTVGEANLLTLYHDTAIYKIHSEVLHVDLQEHVLPLQCSE